MAGGGEIRVLLVGADPADATAAARQLEAREPPLTVEVVTAAEQARAKLSGTGDGPPIDCVLCEATLGGGTIPDFLEAVHEDHPDLPVVLYTDAGDHEQARAAFEAGATDYVAVPAAPESDPGTDPGGGPDDWRWTSLAHRLARTVAHRRARDRAEDDRRERERRLDAVLERSPWPIYLKDPDGRYLLVNEAAAGMFGLSVDDFTNGRTDADLFDAETAAEIRLRDEEVIESGEPIEYEAAREIDGETRHLFNVKAPYVVDGEIRGVVGFSLDISPLRAREAELRAERDHVAALFSNIGDAIVEYELDGSDPVVRRVNPAFEDVFGYDAATVEGEYLDDYLVPAGRTEEAADLNDHVATGNALETEVTRLTADGEREFRLVSVPIEDEDADASRGYAIYSDITELAERERELRRQNERLEEFASVVGHDLQNPLMVADGALELLRTDVAGDETAEGHLETLERALSRMSQLLEDLLTLARSGQAVEEPESVPLSGAVESAWTTVETSGADLECSCEHTVRADPSRLRQLLENCFRNAVEHGGESVSVRIEEHAEGFAVHDDGPGIPPEERERVFESGYSTAETGTGFGLSIVEDIAEAHGWSISIEESDAGGAAIVVDGVDVVEEG